jgi:hypothetical protein
MWAQINLLAASLFNYLNHTSNRFYMVQDGLKYTNQQQTRLLSPDLSFGCNLPGGLTWIGVSEFNILFLISLAMK